MNILKKNGPWIISALLCILAVEVLGAAMFYWNTKSIVYFNQPKATATEPADTPAYRRHLHPYFGYTGPYSLRGSANTNNLGFLQQQQREVPFHTAPNDFVVFVFGGSVASRLVNNSQGGVSLQEALQKLPQLVGKNIVLYNMAQGPAKQPQQLMELAFLIAVGQHIDLVLNLDGTLEFASGITNSIYGVDPIFPPVDIILALGNELAPANTSSAEYYALAYRVTHARDESKRYASLLAASASGIAYVKNIVFKAIYDRNLEDGLRAYNKIIAMTTGWEGVRKLVGLDMPVKTRSKEEIVEYIFDMWLQCSDLMKTMANSKGAGYLHVVPPNPYHSKKPPTESEQAFLKAPPSEEFRYGSSAGHTLIESRAGMLKFRGIVLGLTMFDDIFDTVYIDGSGHFSKLGETMLADLVADQVDARLRSQQGK